MVSITNINTVAIMAKSNFLPLYSEDVTEIDNGIHERLRFSNVSIKFQK